MKLEFVLKKCNKCGSVVMNLDEESSDIQCCGEKMEVVVSNSTDAVFEKHVPTYKIEGEKIIAKVNHVMEEEHYIEWIVYVTEKGHEIRYFEPYMIAETEFDYVQGSKLYAYCNKHGLWESEVI